jgi:ADP-heptose:LPS heptosyltransferase
LRSTSCKEIAQQVLDECLAGHPPRKLPRALAEDNCGSALFGVLVEGLADRFEPALCDAYARLFSQAVAYVRPEVEPGSLVARYERVRRIRPVVAKPQRVYILSRVTLGADVAVTSVILAAAKRRFPHAQIFFVGPHKNYELFASDPHIHHAPVTYSRGGVQERLAVWRELQALTASQCVVLDPDSRLSQLGLLPLCDEESHHLFESRSYGADTCKSLPELAADWAGQTLGIQGARPYLPLKRFLPVRPYIAVSLGVGENENKRLGGDFEERLLKLLAGLGLPLCVDQGAGGSEAQRVQCALERSGVAASTWSGPFSGFASLIASSRLYVGYDSAGQHVAAACGVPLISIFAGYATERFFDRWCPAGAQSRVIRGNGSTTDAVLQQVSSAVSEFRLAAHA